MRFKPYVLFALCLGASAWGAPCELGDWLVRARDPSATWAGSFEKAARSPKKWQRVTDWQLNRARYFGDTSIDAYAVAVLKSEKAYVQGLCVSDGHVEVRLNGERLDPVAEGQPIWALHLQQGDNTLELRVMGAERGNRKGAVHLSLCELEYIFPSRAKRVRDTARSIRHLGERFEAYDAEGLLKHLAELERANAPDTALEAFRHEALVLKNPVVDFDRVLFRASNSASMPSNWRGNSHYLHRNNRTMSPVFRDAVATLELKSRATTDIYRPKDPKEAIMDLCLDWSGEKFLYSGIDTATSTFQVREMKIDGTGRRQLTEHMDEIDHYNAIYLPSGKILFCSTIPLNSVPCVGGKDYVGTLFEMNADGSDLRQVTFDQENNWYPWVKDDGKVMYHRWEYTDNSHYFTRVLMEMNPDGSNNRSIYGSNSYWPNTLFYAKQIPGSTSRFCAIVSGHHGVARAGELWVFDQDQGDFEGEGAIRKIPGRDQPMEFPIIDKYALGKWPLFLHPYPLDDDFFLVSMKQTPRSKWALYLVDTFDNMIPLGESKQQMFEPIPLRPRPTPPVIPLQRRPDADHATLFIQDIYQGPGLAGVPRGEVAALRIFTYGYAYRDTGSHDALAIEGGWDTKRVLGTVPVQEDGSVMVNIPHNMPLSLQPLDQDGKAMQVMRSWLAAQPGELYSCVGCHEPSRTAPPPSVPLAARAAPRELEPWSKVGRPYNYGFRHQIQPILDRYCVGCHDGADGVPNFQDASEVNFGRAKFSKSYMALHPYVRRPGPESDLHLLTPLDYHASTSELFQLLEKGHHGVELADADLRELITWVDLNVPYTATWLEYRDDERTREMARRTVEYKKKYACLDDDIEWMPPVPPRAEFVPPRAPPQRPQPLVLEGWPFVPDAKPETKVMHMGGVPITMVRVPAGRFVMGSVTGARDEFPQAVVEIKKPFWISATEITNGQFRKFNPRHDSRFIDQQWKDHIFPGYPANEDGMPAVRVSWSEARAFCEWLSTETGKAVALPSEAQWEWAARAGSDQPFHFGESGFENHANLADEMLGELAVRGVDPQPLPAQHRSPLTDFVPRDDSFNDGRMIPDGVAQYEANPWGLYDMHGNVAEWTRSDYKPYPYVETDGRNAGAATTRKVARGGSWRDRPYRATASYRLGYKPYQKVFNVGFRIVIED